jgi:hypothetical protein
MRTSKPLRDQHGDRRPHQILWTPAEEPLHCLIRIQDPIVGSSHNDAVIERLDNRDLRPGKHQQAIASLLTEEPVGVVIH